jgi:hypothetical protein
LLLPWQEYAERVWLIPEVDAVDFVEVIMIGRFSSY